MSRPTPATDPEADKPLHPLPRGLVELYGLVAVLVVLVPEWMASGALLTLLARRGGAALPAPTRAWRQLPELRLASMSLAELRLNGYGGQAREPLTARLLQCIKRRREL